MSIDEPKSKPTKTIRSTEDIAKKLEAVKLPPTLKEKLQRIGERILEQQAKEAAKELRKQIAPGGSLPPQQMWLPCAPMPTDMCRVSPFFPVARQNLGEREFIRDRVITSSSWGEILFTGPKLTTYEEDVLNAVLAILDMVPNRKKTEHEGRQTYTYKGPLLPLLRLISSKISRPGKNHYKQILGALDLMQASIVKLKIRKRMSNGNSKTVSLEQMNVIAYFKWDEKEKELTVTINPYFYECFANGNITLIDVLQRSELGSPIAKSLYRFIMSHRDDRWEGHFLTLAASLNLDLGQPQWKIKQLIGQAIKRLINKDILAPSSGVKSGSDIAKLQRTDSSKKRRLTA